VANGTEIPWGSFRKSRELFSFRSRHADHWNEKFWKFPEQNQVERKFPERNFRKCRYTFRGYRLFRKFRKMLLHSLLEMSGNATRNILLLSWSELFNSSIVKTFCIRWLVSASVQASIGLSVPEFFVILIYYPVSASPFKE
jgi:hypothetical protein